MIRLILFCFLLLTCWPLALLALVLYPFVWLLLLPFRIIGLAVGGLFHLVEAIFLLPLVLLRGRREPRYAYASYPQVLPPRRIY